MEASSSLDIKRLLGCWNSADNQNWEYGFFEKFAIYHCDFWEYESIQSGKDKADVVLRKGDKTVLESQEAYRNLGKQDILYVESLKKTDHLKESKDANKLLQELITPYKGKVIYLDIWGTWCGPCKMEMTYVPPIKDAMSGKDVIFMYLANNSPEESWKNVIKESKLTGPNVVHYNLPSEQQDMLERLLSIKFFPTYILIDKEGNIADMNPPHPSQGEMLLKKLDELLTK